MAYATYEDVQARMTRELTTDEQAVCTALLDDAAVMIDSYNSAAEADVKSLVSVRMVMRAMSDTSVDIPLGATQGSMSALGYSQSWTMGTGSSVGELYLGRTEKKLLGVRDKIGSYSPVQELAEVIL
jgi:hypothetical protein